MGGFPCVPIDTSDPGILIISRDELELLREVSRKRNHCTLYQASYAGAIVVVKKYHDNAASQASICISRSQECIY
jgi:hypothetical protein